MGKIQKRYDELITKGEIKSDPAQIELISQYDALLQKIEENHFRKSILPGWLTRRSNRIEKNIKGLYTYGEVGRGKTMLMDMFFSCLPNDKKKRMHFHVFINDVHDRIKMYRQSSTRKDSQKNNPFPDVAAALAEETHILCFDEFAVTDIADAMILSRLFTELFRRNIILIATSNVAPDNLYSGGLNRQLFLPFIEILKSHVNIINLDIPLDYRREKIGKAATYMTPCDKITDKKMDEAWRRETGNATCREEHFTIRGRIIRAPHAVDSLARFEFSDLCSNPLSAFDYIALATRYSTFFIDHVPVFDDDHHDEAKRFILLIDTLYDHHARLFISADASPDELYKGHRKTIELFEFDRTASRLFEMQSKNYLNDWVEINSQKE